jgi:ferredoxin
MANYQNRVAENIAGAFFVDRACIDCDLCRQTAPSIFGRKSVGGEGYSYVSRQPVTTREMQLCQDALEACPVEAIGMLQDVGANAIAA